jgi:hypothetical protein
VDISQSQFNNGQELLALGIVLWEIPSNFVLYRVGPSVWISAQIVAWGLVATLQAFQHGQYSLVRNIAVIVTDCNQRQESVPLW